MKALLKATLSTWIIFKIYDATIGVLSEKIWSALARQTVRFKAQMGWA